MTAARAPGDYLVLAGREGRWARLTASL